MTAPHYPEVEVTIGRFAGNRLAVLGLVIGAMNDAGVPPEQVSAFVIEVNRQPETYDATLAVIASWVTVRAGEPQR